jgi:hypothetical protein
MLRRSRHAESTNLDPKPAMLRSFFFAGFEGTTTWNRQREWIDQVVATQHDVQADADYRRLREAGLLAAREAVRWPLVDHRGRYDFSTVEPFLEASRRNGVDVIWDLFHYGYPGDLDPFSEEFIQRFAAYCHAAARFIRERTEGECFFTPVNEPSFFAWAGGEVGRFAPHLHGRAADLKIALARAAIAGIEAIWDAAPTARIINVDPLCHVVPPHGHEGRHAGADDFNFGVVFESWDMIGGLLLPELGGSRDHLDVIGINYYWTNQWEIGREECALDGDDPRRVPLAELMRRVWRRYGGEFMITETAHVNAERAPWLRCVVDECTKVLDEHLPLRGVCLYPILGMPEWHDRMQWTRMGLWDLEPKNGHLERIPCEPMFAALRDAQHLEARQVASADGQQQESGLRL